MVSNELNISDNKKKHYWWGLNKYFIYIIFLILAGCEDEGCNSLANKSLDCEPLDLDNYEPIHVDHSFKFRVKDYYSEEICDNFSIRIKYKHLALKDCDIFTDPTAIGVPHTKDMGEQFNYFTNNIEYHTINIGDGFDYQWAFDFLPMRITITTYGEKWGYNIYNAYYELGFEKRNNLDAPVTYSVFERSILE